MDKRITLEMIQTWIKDEDCDVRAVAMNAWQGKDIPLDIIKTGLKDEDWRVRTAAMNACQGRNIVIRTVEPPERVFKKCINNVIIVAHIPDNANVRGTFNSKCRADKAEIIDIIGDVSGYKVGISMYDKSTAYFVGDKVIIKDFDFSTAECSTGFHFFNTLEEAQYYE